MKQSFNYCNAKKNKIKEKPIECICKWKDTTDNETSIPKKRKSNTRSEGKPLLYPNSNELISKTFQIKFERNLSSFTKLLLNSFQNKYLYYAIDDILYLLKSHPIERDNLLAILYSPVLSLQNNLSINFFDIWIQEIYISEVSKVNKFLTSPCQKFEPFTHITIKLLYRTKTPIKKQESLW